MSKPQRILTLALWGLTVISMMALIAAWTSDRARRVDAASRWHVVTTELKPMGYDVPEFALTDQDNKPLTKTDLKGHPWIASFIFTRCAGSCPAMSTKMGTLQKTIPDSRVKLISFTVDPDHDTPEVLKTYATHYGADPGRWSFVTGPKETIAQVAAGLKLGLQYSPNPTDITHSEKFVLIDPTGHVSGYYDGTNENDLKHLAEDASKLAKAR